jgi:hypothetical protein
MATIRCTVDNCFYWARDNYCGADTILITSDDAVRRYPEGVDAPQAQLITEDIGETPARSATDTACKTFRHREHDPHAH